MEYTSGSIPTANQSTDDKTTKHDQNIAISMRHIHICLSVEFLVALNNFVVVALNNSSKHLDSLRRLQELQSEAAQTESENTGTTGNSASNTRLRRISRDARASVVRRLSSMPASTDSPPRQGSPKPHALSAASSKCATEQEPSEMEGQIIVTLSLEQPEVVLIADAKSESSKAVLLHGAISAKYVQTNETMMISMETKELALRHLRYKDIVEGNVQYGRKVFKPCSVDGKFQCAHDFSPFRIQYGRKVFNQFSFLPVMVIKPKNQGYKIDVNIDKTMELDVSPKVRVFDTD